MRASATASIAFGLVTVPVKMYAAHEPSSDVSFNLLHKTCHSRLRQQHVCIKEEVVVDKEAQIRGFEFEKDKYVTFTDEELAQLNIVDDDQTITIDYFVKLEEIDTIYFDGLQFLGPDKGADRSYTLLARAMAKAKRVAIARYVARGKQHLVMLLSVDDRLVMRYLHYVDEVRSLDEVLVQKVSTPASELKLAVDLVRELEQPQFDAGAYRDELKLRKRERINAKIEGREIVAPSSEKKGADIIDLADALRASINKKSKSARSSSSTSTG